MNEENIVSLSLQYYDKQKARHALFYTNDHKVSYISSKSDLDFPRFEISSRDKVVLKGFYNIMGCYFKDEKKWVWGWGINYTQKNDSYLSRKILLYGLDLVIDTSAVLKDNSRDPYNRLMLDLMVKNDLTSKEIPIDHPTQLEQYLALGLYLTKGDMVYREDGSEKFGKNVVVYLVFKHTDL
jgi:hypothetical protein